MDTNDDSELWQPLEIFLTLKEELVDRLHIQDESSIRYFCSKYKNYHNDTRPHQGFLGKTPCEIKVENSTIQNLSSIKYKKIKHVHCLFTEFKLVA